MYRADGRATEITVTDLYLASYLLMSGCPLAKVECIPTGSALSCSLFFSHQRVPDLEDAFFEQRAVVNLTQFRTAYNQVNGLVHQAKKSYEREQRRSASEAAGGSSATGGGV